MNERMTKTKAKGLVREIRKEALAVADVLDTYGMERIEAEPRLGEWIADRLNSIDGISALLREGLTEREV